MINLILSHQVGACIVNRDGQVVGVGYNGFVKGIHDDDKTIPWEKNDEHPARQKLPYGKAHNTGNCYIQIMLHQN